MEKQAREQSKIFMPPTGRDANLDLYIELIKARGHPEGPET